MPNGIIIIDKAQGWTSMDVCAKLRGMFHEKRVGHAGTLDPMATGVLPVFIGRATRGVEFAEQGDKEYLAGLRLGQVTDTQDTSGQVLSQHPVEADRAALEQVLDQFRGQIQQVPPMYSAVKIGGKKLYELARKGKEVERKPRTVTIRRLEVLEQVSDTDYLIRVVCSKGTYIRTLCHEIGQALGCGGVMYSLRRTMAAGYLLEQAVTLEQVQQAADRGEAEGLLAPADSLFMDRPALTVTARQEKNVRNGLAFSLPQAEPGEYRVYGADGSFLMLGKVAEGKLSTIKSFFEV